MFGFAENGRNFQVKEGSEVKAMKIFGI